MRRSFDNQGPSPVVVIGNIVSGIGILLFLSNFVVIAFTFGEHAGPSAGRWFAMRAVGGMLLIISGQAIAAFGRWLNPQSSITRSFHPASQHLSDLRPPPPAAKPWTCAYCQGRNDGALHECRHCGAAFEEEGTS